MVSLPVFGRGRKKTLLKLNLVAWMPLWFRCNLFYLNHDTSKLSLNIVFLPFSHYANVRQSLASPPPVGKIKAKITFLNFFFLLPPSLPISLRKDFLRFRLSKDFQRQISAKCRRMREKFSFPFIGRRLNGEKYGKEIFEYRKSGEWMKKKCLMGITIDERAPQPGHAFPHQLLIRYVNKCCRERGARFLFVISEYFAKPLLCEKEKCFSLLSAE